MKIFRLAVLGAAAYGVKKWLDQNPKAKEQAKQAADRAKEQATKAAEQVKHQVDERRQGGSGDVWQSATSTGTAGAGAAGTGSTLHTDDVTPGDVPTDATAADSSASSTPGSAS